MLRYSMRCALAVGRLTTTSLHRSPPSNTPVEPADFSQIPQWGPKHTDNGGSSSRSFRDPTNHVGEIGVMSRMAVERRLEEEEKERQRQSSSSSSSSKESPSATTTTPASSTTSARPSSRKTTASPFLHMGKESLSSPSFLTSRADLGASRRWGEGEARIRQITREKKGSPGSEGQGKPLRAASSSAKRHSGVQTEILVLYRQLLKETKKFRDADTRKSLYDYIKADFDKQSEALKRTQINNIEWQINYGKRKLSELQRMTPDVKFSIKH